MKNLIERERNKNRIIAGPLVLTRHTTIKYFLRTPRNERIFLTRVSSKEENFEIPRVSFFITLARSNNKDEYD